MPSRRAVLVALLFPLLLAFALPAAAQQEDDPDEPAWLSIMGFRGSLPAGGLEVRVDGEATGRLDRLGSFETRVAPGEHTVVLRDEGAELLRRRLNAEAGDDIRITVTLGEGGEASTEVTAAGGSGELVAETDAEPGRVTGRVVDSEEETPVADARVLVRGTAAEARTDEDGTFELELPSGEQTLSVVHGDYATRSLSAVTVPAEETAELGDVELTPAGLDLGEFVVTAPYVEGSVASSVSRQREAGGVSDVMGADQMSAAGDSDAADTVGRVAGISLQGGRYAVIRGLESRYTTTLWNGGFLPSPNPLRRTVPLDLFPTSTLEAVEVKKTWSPDLPGTFGGGLVNMETRGVPDSAYFEIGASVGMNSLATGQTGLDYDGGDSDWRAADDGTRELPEAFRGGALNDSGQIPTDRMEELGGSFSNNYAVKETTAGPDRGVDLAAGNRWQTEAGTYGIAAGLTWGQSHERRDRVEREFASAGDDLIETDDVDRDETLTDSGYGGLMTLSGAWGEDHEVVLNHFVQRQATDRVERRAGEVSGGDDSYKETYTLEWVEQGLDVQQLRGEHAFPALLDLGVDWRWATATGTREAPDRRLYSYRGSDADSLTFEPHEFRREYATLEDESDTWSLDFALPLGEDSAWPTTLSAGASSLEKERDTTRRTFTLEGRVDQSEVIVGNPEPLLDEEALEGGEVAYGDSTQGSDYLAGSQEQTGRYAMVDTEWAETLRLVGGIRQERVELETRKPRIEDSEPSRVEVDEDLTSLAATWAWSENQQLRAAWSETLSVPDLAEIAEGYYNDPVSGDRFLGNPDGLRPTTLSNRDLRWEWYPSEGETLSLAWFSKDFTDPIETAYTPSNLGNPLTFQNAETAEVSGWELGWRKHFGFLGTAFEPLYFAGNLTQMESSITLAEEEAGTNTNTERPLQGQADQLLNLELGYDGERHRGTLLLSQVGERITEVGTFGRPDVYRKPVPRLSAVYRWSPSEALEVKLSGGNLLDPTIEYTQAGRIREAYSEGRDFGLSVTWRHE